MAATKAQCIAGPINFTAAGNNTVVAAPSSGPIAIYGLVLYCDADTDITFYNGTKAQSGPIPVLGVTLGLYPLVYEMLEDPWFYTDPGNAFIINSSSPSVCTGTVYYTLG
jgi:hypothetical protein